MANNNLKAIEKVASSLGLAYQVIPSATNPLNCSKLLVNGKEFKTTQWTKIQAEAILDDFVNGCTKTTLQEVERPAPFACLFPIANRKLLDVLDSYRIHVENTMNILDNVKANHYNTWIDELLRFYDNDVNKVADVIHNQIKTKQIYVIDGYVYIHLSLTYLIKEWIATNNLKFDNVEAMIDDTIYKWTSAMGCVEVL